MSRYLGVDGGGSKTAFALVDGAGVVLARATAPGSYYFRDGFGVVEAVLTQGLSDICATAGIAPGEIDFAFFGLPGYGEASADVEQLDAIPARVLGHRRYGCDNDMVCGWAGSLAGEDGINVISGTGSMAYGERLGARSRVGGWGEVFGDEGSAYWVATQALNAFGRMSDGRSPRSALYDLLRRRLQIRHDLDAVSVVAQRSDRSSVAALATSVCDAARDGDEHAVAILAAGAHELAALVETARVSLGFADHDQVPVSYSGGMFCDDGYLAQFHAALENLPAKYDLRAPLLDPAVGAALYAAKRSGREENQR